MIRLYGVPVSIGQRDTCNDPGNAYYATIFVRFFDFGHVEVIPERPSAMHLPRFSDLNELLRSSVGGWAEWCDEAVAVGRLLFRGIEVALAKESTE